MSVFVLFSRDVLCCTWKYIYPLFVFVCVVGALVFGGSGAPKPLNLHCFYHFDPPH